MNSISARVASAGRTDMSQVLKAAKALASPFLAAPPPSARAASLCAGARGPFRVCGAWLASRAVSRVGRSVVAPGAARCLPVRPAVPSARASPRRRVFRAPGAPSPLVCPARFVLFSPPSRSRSSRGARAPLRSLTKGQEIAHGRQPPVAVHHHPLGCHQQGLDLLAGAGKRILDRPLGPFGKSAEEAVQYRLPLGRLLVVEEIVGIEAVAADIVRLERREPAIVGAIDRQRERHRNHRHHSIFAPKRHVHGLLGRAHGLGNGRGALVGGHQGEGLAVRHVSLLGLATRSCPAPAGTRRP